LREEVYCFDNCSIPTAQVNVVGSHNLWHGHLGHSSDQVFNFFSKDLEFSFENKVNEPRDICFHGKQTCLKFATGESNAKELVELIHCDI